MFTDLTEEELDVFSLKLEDKFQNLICQNSIPQTKSKHVVDIEEESLVEDLVSRKSLGNFFFRVYLLKKFCTNLKKSIEKSEPNIKLLKNVHPNVCINDLTFFQTSINKNILNGLSLYLMGFKNYFLISFLGILDKKIFIFGKSSMFVILYSHILSLISIFIIIMVPIHIFDLINDKYNETLEDSLSFSFIAFCLNIFLKFNTAFLKNGVSIKNRKLILEEYLKKCFLKDFLGLICFALHYLHPMFLLFFVFYLMTMKKHTKNYLNLNSEIIKMVLMLILLIHYMSCFWVFIGKISIKLNYDSWLLSQHLNEIDPFVQYLYSLLYILQKITFEANTIINPKNELEICSVILLKMIIFISFIYYVIKIGFLMFESFKRKLKKNQNFLLIKKLLEKNKISQKTKIKVRNFLKHNEKRNCFENKIRKQAEFISKMPETLQNDLLKESIDPYIKKIPAISQNFSEESIKKLRKCFEKIKICKNETIFNKNDIDDKSLYLILKGTVSINLTNGINPVSKTGNPGEIIDVITFFSNKPRSFTVKTMTDTVLLRLNQEIFLKVINENANDYERFCQIKDNINLYNDFKDIFITCMTCSLDHDLQHCPLNHYIPHKDNIISKFIFSIPEKQRRKCTTRKKKKEKCKKIQKKEDFELNNKIEDYIDNLSDDSCYEVTQKSQNFEDILFDKNYDIDAVKTNDNENYFKHNYFERVITNYHLTKKKVIRTFQSNFRTSKEISNTFVEILNSKQDF